MAKSYKELSAELGRRGMDNFTSFADDLLDAAAMAPAKAVESIQNVKANMTRKSEVIATTIEAKLMLQDKMLDEIPEAEFAYRLAQDENLRKTVNLLTQEILQPTPLEASPARKDNPFINIGAGLSAYWTEMQQKLPIEIENASQVENILMNINSGLDMDMDPDTRKLFLREAGMTREQVNELVPIQDYVAYENKVKDGVRAEVMSELGLDGDHELTEQEQLLIDSLSEDRMMNTKLQSEMPPEDYTPTYEETYGIAAQDMYVLFGDEEKHLPEPESFEDVPIDDPDWASLMEMSGADQGYWDMMEGTIEDNMAMLQEAEAREAAMESNLALSEADLIFDDPGQDYSDAPDFGISEADLAFAEQYADMDLNQ